ncbi:Periplasmic thiol:disulfide oxidoreductase DsbB, required for DsbA reoxidation [Rubrivivax sp. A210]|uniref:disulfide bond formation protein B n=1 Tax=Rubrivivax sp. A210 TaxID=2772301 RepID=UPI001918145A|nr:disulfide bond formation protein B [Rubrivivax sp. A210]CAD5374595.1 Periplasmic thiol:disulfide oxidoreductase DsbB, required for DsbA reoxidation [Rubrivivax sp. A210]
MKLGATQGFAAGALLPPAAVATALFTQHGLGMLPCPWCVLQRLIFLTVALAAVAGLALGGAIARRIAALTMLLVAGCGVAAALWQHFVASASASCNLTLADRIVGATGLDALLPQVFAAYASCADAKATLLGVPYEFYSLTLFSLLSVVSLLILLGRLR